MRFGKIYRRGISRLGYKSKLTAATSAALLAHWYGMGQCQC